LGDTETMLVQGADPGLDGLDEQEARRRLANDGPNELPRTARGGLASTAIDVVREPMILLLLAAGAVYFVLGDPIEAIPLAASIALIIAIELYQERRTERALEALREQASPRALVIRGGVRKRIAGREVVRGDLLALSEGDRIPADGLLVTASGFSADESLLTGESVTVRKTAGAAAPAERRPGGDDLPYVYSGTLVTSGQGLATVVATGAATEMGRIGTALQGLTIERTGLQRETDRVVRLVAMAALAVCTVVVVGHGLSTGSFLQGLLAGLTVAMSLVPEEFPVVLTVFLALGAWRIARSRVLTRRVPAIEALGAATVLCVDKTGTLTENRMTVAALATDGPPRPFDAASILPAHRHVLAVAALACPPEPFDPMDRAIQQAARSAASGAPGTIVRAYPLSEQLLAVTQVWEFADRPARTIAAKGAPEAIARLCHLDEAATAARVASMAQQGLRVLGVAVAEAPKGAELPPDPTPFRFGFVGLVGLADPVRPTVPAAVAESRTAGVRVVMLTGDYPETARAIGRQAGLVAGTQVLTGHDLEAMDEPTLCDHARRTTIFARVRPEQKLRLVRALQANGDIVAMTGDGVNDAPALKAADIGIAMGDRGTDVAREAAALVLMDDDFASIVRAIRLGRRIFDNLRKAMGFLLAVHVPIAGIALLPVLADRPLILLPLHIVFLELIIDPACSLVFEAEREHPRTMQRPPRPVSEPLFNRQLVLFGALQGVGVLVVSGSVLIGAWLEGLSADAGRTLTFATLVLGNIGLILSNSAGSGRDLLPWRHPNRALWAIVGATLAILCLVVIVPATRDLFAFAPLSAAGAAVVLVAGTVSFLWLYALVLARSRRGRATAAPRSASAARPGAEP